VTGTNNVYGVSVFKHHMSNEHLGAVGAECNLLENAPVTWSTTTAWIALTAGLKQTTAFRMIAHRYCDLYQGVLVDFCGWASEIELASSGAVHPAKPPMAWPWCQ
jgi:hypothetical protein